MPTYTRTIEQYVGALKRLKADVPKIIERGLRAAGMRAVAVLQERSAAAVDTAAFKRGWRATVDGKTLTLTNIMAYSDVVVRGRRPGSRMPPPQALEAWVRRKLKVAKKDVRGVAFAVARSIGKRGIRGKPEIVDGAKLDELVDAEIKRAFSEAARR